MGKGKTYELNLVNEITENTSPWVWTTRPDFSGNSKHAFADLAMIWTVSGPIDGAFVEVKKRSPGDGKRASGALVGSADGQTGLEELKELCNGTPPWGEPYLAVKFPNRELIVYRADYLYSDLAESDGGDDYVGTPQLTPSNNVSIRKPSLDEWNSSRGGLDDWHKLCTGVGMPTAEIHTDGRSE
jgi:hypothetical protein